MKAMCNPRVHVTCSLLASAYVLSTEASVEHSAEVRKLTVEVSLLSIDYFAPTGCPSAFAFFKVPVVSACGRDIQATELKKGFGNPGR